jgi:tRNA G18 (ribose-2'-O)-methylase SpoU
MLLAEADSALDAARFFRERGLTIGCTAKRNAVCVYEADLTGPLFLVIGGEKRGMSRGIVDEADMRLWVPYGRSFGASLPTAAAAAVIAFEVMRQRR